ncbi:MAG: EamA family transporter [Candidatus Micrarchaeia archaeon]
MNLKTKAMALLVLSLFTGALKPIMLDVAKDMNLYEFFMLSYMLAIPFALLLGKISGRGGELKNAFREKKRLVLTVLIGFCSYLPIGFFIMLSERYVSVSLATVVFRTSPLLMLIFLPIVLKERLTKYQVLALSLGFFGIYIALSGGNLLSLFQNPNIPVILFLASGALIYAFSAVLAKKYAFDMASGIAVFTISLSALFALIFVFTGLRFSPINTVDLIAIAYVAIANDVIGFFAYFTALRSLKTTIVTNVYFASPFLTFLFAALLLGEPIKAYYLIIALLVVAGLLIQRKDVRGGTYLQKQHTGATIFDVSAALVGSKDLRIYGALKSGGKVLAIKLNKETYDVAKQLIQSPEFSSYGVFVFEDGHDVVRDDEREYIREIMGLSEGEHILMSAGNVKESEELLNRLLGKVNSAKYT